MKLASLAVLFVLPLSLFARDPLIVGWPKRGAARTRNYGLLGRGLVSIPQTSAPPTAEDLLQGPPFRWDGRRVALDLASLHPEDREAFASRSNPDLALKDFIEVAAEGYTRRRPFPKTLEALREQWGIDQDPQWSSVRILSVISHGPRRIFFRRDQVLAAGEPGEKDPYYPPGTKFLAEEYDQAGNLVEVHVSRRRQDHAWDFAIYDASGPRVTRSRNHPKRFFAPQTCQGCHGARVRMPPFSDFPERSREFQGFEPKILESLSPQEIQLVRERKPEGRSLRPGNEILGNYRGLAEVFEARQKANLSEVHP